MVTTCPLRSSPAHPYPPRFARRQNGARASTSFRSRPHWDSRSSMYRRCGTAGSRTQDQPLRIAATPSSRRRGLTELTAIELPFARHRRIVLAATMEVTAPDGAAETIRVASVHFDVLAGPRRLWVFSSGHRARQARALGQMFSRDPAVVLGGDLNTWSEGALEDAASHASTGVRGHAAANSNGDVRPAVAARLSVLPACRTRWRAEITFGSTTTSDPITGRCWPDRATRRAERSLHRCISHRGS